MGGGGTDTLFQRGLGVYFYSSKEEHILMAERREVLLWRSILVCILLKLFLFVLIKFLLELNFYGRILILF